MANKIKEINSKENIIITINIININSFILNNINNNIFTFSSEKVLDLCKMGLPPFLSNVHVLRPPEPEKMVFTNVSVCLSVCLLCVDF